MRSLALVIALLSSLAALAQQPQTSDVSNTQPLYSVNAKYANGVAPGYWPTAGAGLTLNVSKGTCFDSASARHTYAGGTLTMTNSTTNYVVLTAAACSLTSNTTGYGTDIPIATVVTSGGAITTITDDRTGFSAGVVPSSGGVPVCADTSASATTYTCSTSPSFTPSSTSVVLFTAVNQNNSGSSTLNVNGAGAKTIKKQQNAANLAAGDLQAGAQVYMAYDGTNWQLIGQIGNASGASTTTLTTYYPPDWCTPDQTSNSPYPDVLSMTNYKRPALMFISGQAGAVYCQFHVPHNLAGTPNANFVLTFAINDSSNSHTVNFQTCDSIVSSTIDVGALSSCASNQTVTATATAYAPITKTYAAQATFTADSIVLVKVAASTTGTAPSNDIILADIKLKVDETL